MLIFYFGSIVNNDWNLKFKLLFLIKVQYIYLGVSYNSQKIFWNVLISKELKGKQLFLPIGVLAADTIKTDMISYYLIIYTK